MTFFVIKLAKAKQLIVEFNINSYSESESDILIGSFLRSDDTSTRLNVKNVKRNRSITYF